MRNSRTMRQRYAHRPTSHFQFHIIHLPVLARPRRAAVGTPRALVSRRPHTVQHCHCMSDVSIKSSAERNTLPGGVMVHVRVPRWHVTAGISQVDASARCCTVSVSCGSSHGSVIRTRRSGKAPPIRSPPRSPKGGWGWVRRVAAAACCGSVTARMARGPALTAAGARLTRACAVSSGSSGRSQICRLSKGSPPSRCQLAA